jgi:hypothetical protein
MTFQNPLFAIGEEDFVTFAGVSNLPAGEFHVFVCAKKQYVCQHIKTRYRQIISTI